MQYSLNYSGTRFLSTPLNSEIQNASNTALFGCELKSFFSWYKHTLAQSPNACV